MLRRMDVLENYDRAAAVASGVIDKIPTDRFGAPTPCSEWDVRGVVNHMVTGALMAISAATAGEPPEVGGDHVGDDPKGVFERVAKQERELLAQPGAMERPMRVPFGEQPGSFVASMRINELLVHSWDLAKATGQPTDFEPELCAGVLATWRERMDGADRSTHLPFDDEQPVPDDATQADRLAAYLGRRVS